MFLQLLRGQKPTIVATGWQPVNMSAYDMGLRGIRDPTWSWNDQVSVVDQLQDEHQFLGTGADQNMVGVEVQVLSALVVFCNGLLQGWQTTHRQVVFLMSIRLKFFHYR